MAYPGIHSKDRRGHPSKALTNSAKQAEYDVKFQKPWSQKLGIDFLEPIMAPDYTDADVLKICVWCLENPGNFRVCKDLRAHIETQLEDAKVDMFVMNVSTALPQSDLDHMAWLHCRHWGSRVENKCSRTSCICNRDICVV